MRVSRHGRWANQKCFQLSTSIIQKAGQYGIPPVVFARYLSRQAQEPERSEPFTAFVDDVKEVAERRVAEISRLDTPATEMQPAFAPMAQDSVGFHAEHHNRNRGPQRKIFALIPSLLRFNPCRSLFHALGDKCMQMKSYISFYCLVKRFVTDL